MFLIERRKSYDMIHEHVNLYSTGLEHKLTNNHLQLLGNNNYQKSY